MTAAQPTNRAEAEWKAAYVARFMRGPWIEGDAIADVELRRTAEYCADDAWRNDPTGDPEDAAANEIDEWRAIEQEAAELYDRVIGAYDIADGRQAIETALAAKERQVADQMVERCAKVANDAALPAHFQWGRDAMEQFDFGKERAALAIRAQPAPADATSERKPRDD